MYNLSENWQVNIEEIHVYDFSDMALLLHAHATHVHENFTAELTCELSHEESKKINKHFQRHCVHLPSNNFKYHDYISYKILCYKWQP